MVARIEYGAFGEETFVSTIPALANFPYRFVGGLGVRTDLGMGCPKQARSGEGPPRPGPGGGGPSGAVKLHLCLESPGLRVGQSLASTQGASWRARDGQEP